MFTSIEMLLNMYHCEDCLLGVMLCIMVTGYQTAQCHVSQDGNFGSRHHAQQFLCGATWQFTSNGPQPHDIVQFNT